MDSFRAHLPRRIIGLRVVLLVVAVAVGGGLALVFGLLGFAYYAARGGEPLFGQVVPD